MLEKTHTTFHASNMLMQQQYRELRFTKYTELIACLLVAEQNNELLIKKNPNLTLPDLYHYLKSMPQFKLIDVDVDIFTDKAEVIVVSPYFLESR